MPSAVTAIVGSLAASFTSGPSPPAESSVPMWIASSTEALNVTFFVAVLVDGEADLPGQRVEVRLRRAVGPQRLLDHLRRLVGPGQIHLQRQQIGVDDERGQRNAARADQDRQPRAVAVGAQRHAHLRAA